MFPIRRVKYKMINTQNLLPFTRNNHACVLLYQYWTNTPPLQMSCASHILVKNKTYFTKRMMFQVGCMLFFTICYDFQVSASIQLTLSNRSLILAFEPWPPFLVETKDETGMSTYSGVVGDILEYIKEARNCTFTPVRSPDRLWGDCFGMNNCTGMLGQVNRREADIAIGLPHEYVSIME